MLKLKLRTGWALLPLLTFSGQMHAQVPPPPNQLTFSQWIGNELTVMVSQRIGLFVSEGRPKLSRSWAFSWSGTWGSGC
jgi:hypothetical protein